LPIADGRADYIDYNTLRGGKIQSNDAPASSSQQTGGLVAATSELGQSWLADVQNRYLPYSYSIGDKRDLKRNNPTAVATEPLPALASALTTLPIVLSEGVEGPVVIIEAIPEPKIDPDKPEQLRTKPKKRKYRGFNGFFTLGNRSFDADRFSFTSGISYKPVKDSYWFARTSWSYRFVDIPGALDMMIGIREPSQYSSIIGDHCDLAMAWT